MCPKRLLHGETRLPVGMYAAPGFFEHPANQSIVLTE
jgi:hypothetical protein